MSDIRKSLMKHRLPPMGPPGLTGLSRNGPGRSHGGGSACARRDYTPVSWKKYWDVSENLTLENGDVFHIYKRGTAGPVLLLLHGGGYSALTWSLFAECVTEMVECQVLAFDQRGHGDTSTMDETDLSAETLSNDVERVLEAAFGNQQPPCILIGHSMGGAIAVHTASHNNGAGFAGLIVIDVVEGTAMDALSSMQSFLRSRPQNFNSLQTAVEWSLRSGQTRNVVSARISMPGQLKNMESGSSGTLDVENNLENEPQKQTKEEKSEEMVRADMIPEEEETGDSETTQDPKPSKFVVPQSPSKMQGKKYIWRINLAETEKFWPGWFQGLSTKFLSSSPAKMLLLAGIDRLDTDLTVGQMQGKFQMQVLPQCGHAVQEDTPDRVAEVVATFLLRQRLTTPKADFHRSFPAC